MEGRVNDMQTKEKLENLISKWWDNLYLSSPLIVRAASHDMKQKIEELSLMISEQNQHINISSTVEKLLLEIEKDKFDNVSLTIDKGQSNWNNDFALFTVPKIDIGIFEFEKNEDNQFNEADFRISFEKHFQEAFRNDPTVKIIHRYKLHEFEFSRV